jgi:hypothetical protein
MIVPAGKKLAPAVLDVLKIFSCVAFAMSRVSTLRAVEAGCTGADRLCAGTLVRISGVIIVGIIAPTG